MAPIAVFIDSHAHVHFPELAKDPEGVLRRSRHWGVVGAVNVATDLASSREAIQWAERFPNLFPTVGVHPHSALEMDEAGWRELERLAANPRVVAIGETGLDHVRSRSPVEVQREAFRRQIRLAREVGKPLVVHNREADSEVLKWLREEGQGQVRGVFHCFSSTLATAQAALELGFYISFAGNLTYPKNERLREICREVPLDRLLLETDCPFLSPQERRGRTNEPGWLRFSALAVCRARLHDGPSGGSGGRECRPPFRICAPPTARLGLRPRERPLCQPHPALPYRLRILPARHAAARPGTRPDLEGGTVA